MEQYLNYDGHPGNFTSEASTLGFKPGHWPESFQIPNHRTFRMQEFSNDLEGEVTSVVYRNTDGEQVTVFND